MDKWNSKNRHKYLLQYHIIFVCKYRNEDDTPFCGEGHKWEWEYAEEVKRLLKE